MRNGQANDLTSFVTAHGNTVLSHFTVRTYGGTVWLGEVNSKRISLRIVMAPKVVLGQLLPLAVVQSCVDNG